MIFSLKDGKHLYQWDRDRVLLVLDEEVDQVHFANDAATGALTMDVYIDDDNVRVVDIPSTLLQCSCTLTAYAYVIEDGDREYTLSHEEFKVIARKKPDDYIPEEEADKWHRVREEVQEAAEAATEAAKRAADSETEAENSATAAADSATTAQNSATESTRAMQEALRASSDAMSSRIEVQGRQAAVEEAQAEAEKAQAAAETAASSAVSSAGEANAHKTFAQQQAEIAYEAANNAAASESNAAKSEDEAAKWATNANSYSAISLQKATEATGAKVAAVEAQLAAESSATAAQAAQAAAEKARDETQNIAGGDYATKEYVQQNGGKIQSVSVNGTAQTIDANKNVNITVPTKVSQLENDSKFLTSVPSEYVTETELAGKGYLTELPSHAHSQYLTEVPGEYVTETELASKGFLTQHQDISGKANVSDLNSHTGNTTVHITSSERSTWNNKANKATTLSGYGITDGAKAADLTSHTGNTTAHITAAERTKWNQGITDISNLSGEIVDQQNEINILKAQGMQQTPLKPQGSTVEEQVAWLAENGDTAKYYLLADGFLYGYEETVTAGGEPLFTNALDGVTKNINKRWSRSSKALSTSNGYMTVTVPVKADQTVYVNLPFKAFQAGYSRIHYLDASGNYVSGKDWQANLAQAITTDENGVSSWVTGYEFGTSGDASSNTRLSNADNITQMVVALAVSYANTGSHTELTEGDVADIILSIGNPIEYSTGSIVKAWANTGQAFVPADYDKVIAGLVDSSNRNTADILELQETVKNWGTETDVDVIEHIKNWDSPIYDKAPVFQLSTEKTAVTSADKTVEAVYAKYDALMARNTDFITKTDLGVCSDGVTHVYRYDFKESEPHTVSSSNWSETKPKIIIVSGVHREWGGIYSLYHALEEITTNSELDELRRNLHLIVVPIMNPYCIIGDVWNKNYNGVEVRRNFEVGFAVVDQSSDHYGGTAPLSEVESQYIDNIFKANADAVYFLSCHSMTRDNLRGTGFMWGSSATNYMCNMAFRLIDKLSKAWHSKYGTTWEDGVHRENDYVLANPSSFPNAVEQAENDYRAGWASISTSAGTEQRQATKYGMQATNLEVCDYFRVLDDSLLSAKVMTHGAEVYINFLLTAMGVYDRKDRAEYFKG